MELIQQCRFWKVQVTLSPPRQMEPAKMRSFLLRWTVLGLGLKMGLRFRVECLGLRVGLEFQAARSWTVMDLFVSKQTAQDSVSTTQPGHLRSRIGLNGFTYRKPEQRGSERFSVHPLQ